MKVKSKLQESGQTGKAYGIECLALQNQDEQQLHLTDIKMETIEPSNSVLTQRRTSRYEHVMRGEDTHMKRSAE